MFSDFAKFNIAIFFSDNGTKRAKSNLASVRERITAFNKFRNPEALKQLGWVDVPIVDVKSYSAWIEATNEIASGGYSHCKINDWVNKPIALANHRFFQFDNIYVNTISEINNEIEFTEQIDDVKSYSAWIEATNEIASGGYSHCIINDWVKYAIMQNEVSFEGSVKANLFNKVI